MPPLQLTLFGPLHVTLGEAQVTGFRSDKVRALLVYLAIETNRPHRRDALAGLLWPEQDEAKAHDNLRLSLHRLRAALDRAEAGLAAALLQVTPKTIQFNPCPAGPDAPLACVDVLQFSRLLAECRLHRHVRLSECSACDRRMAQAVDLYRGELLEGFFLDSQPFEEWLLVQRENLRSQALETLHALAGHAECSGDYALAQHYARRQLQIDPWREEAHCQLMRSLALNGQRSAALAQYETCTGLLHRELGAEPGDEMRALYEQLIAGENLSFYGSSASCEQAIGFPAPITPFIGRQDELARVEAALENSACRLLTLIGPGGVGKSRLAIQAGRRLAGSRLHGAYFVPLTGIDRPEHLASAIAVALGIKLRGRDEPLAQVIATLRNKELLLVLDELEHLMGAVPEIAQILGQAAGVKLLVTSRQRLDLPGEQTVVLNGLDCPPGAGSDTGLKTWSDFESFSAISLFSETAARMGVQIKTRPKDWPATVRICQLTEGLPLGIELAASWLRLLSAAEIAGEIERDLQILETAYPEISEKHRSLRAVCDASWRLLNEEERALLSKLAIFRGGFTLEAARQAAAATPQLLSALADKSLLRRQGEDSFGIYEPVRQYGYQKLCATLGEVEKALARHSAYYQAFVAQRQEALRKAQKRGEPPTTILAELARESDNLQASWKWLLRRAGEAGEIASYVDGLGLVYECLGQPQQAAELYELALEWIDAYHPLGDQQLRGHWQYGLGKTYLSLGMIDRSKQQLELSLECLGQRLPATPLAVSGALLGEVAAQAFWQMVPWRPNHRRNGGGAPAYLDAAGAFSQLTEVNYLSNRRQHSIYYALRVLNLAAGSETSPEQARTLASICLAAGLFGWRRLASVYYRQARRLAQELDDAFTSAYVFQVTGFYDIGLGRWESARQALERAAALFDRLNYRWLWGECVMPQAVIASAQGQFSRVEELLEMLWAASIESGNRMQEGWVLGESAYLHLMRGETGRAVSMLQNWLEITRQAAHLPGQISANGLLAVAYLRHGDYLAARQTADKAAALIARSSHTMFTNTEGYSSVVEAFLGLIEWDSDSTVERKILLRQAEQVLKAMRIQARGVPAGFPRYWLQLGWFHWLSGAQARAFQDWERSLETSRRLNIPYDQGRAGYEIGRRLPSGDARRQVYLEQAAALFEGLGAIYYLRLAREEMQADKFDRMDEGVNCELRVKRGQLDL